MLCGNEGHVFVPAPGLSRKCETRGLAGNMCCTACGHVIKVIKGLKGGSTGPPVCPVLGREDRLRWYVGAYGLDLALPLLNYQR